MGVYVAMFWFLIFGTTSRLLSTSISSVRACFVLQFMFCVLEIGVLFFSRRLRGRVTKALCFFIGVLPCAFAFLFSYIWNAVSCLVLAALIWTTLYGEKQSVRNSNMVASCIATELALFVVFLILSYIRGEETDHQVAVFSLSVLCYAAGVIQSGRTVFANPEPYPHMRNNSAKRKRKNGLTADAHLKRAHDTRRIPCKGEEPDEESLTHGGLAP